jgi:hypothetical protein
MPRRISYNGRIIEVPDDATDEEVAMVLEESDRASPGSSIGAMVGASARPDSPVMQSPRAQEFRRQYRGAYQRRAQERAPRGEPGSLERGISDFNRNGPAGMTDQMWRNVDIADEVAGFGAQIRAGGIPGTSRGEGAYQGARQYELDRREEVAREQPILNATSWAASVPAMGGRIVPGRVSALAAGGGTALVNTPFALARQDGDFVERLPGAAQETAAVFGLGSGLQGIANRVTRAPRPNSGRSRAADFEAAGVRPTQAAVSGGAPAGLTRMISENFLAGGPARARMAASIDDTSAGAERIARAFSPEPVSREAAGQVLQRGLRRFGMGEGAAQQRPSNAIRNYSFDQRSNAIYETVFGRIRQAEQNWISRGQAAPVTADQTRAVIDDILGRNTPEVSAMLNRGNPLTEFRALLGGRGGGNSAAAGARVTFQDLRDLRTFVRNQRSIDPSSRPTLPDAALARLESALSADINASARFIAGDQVARQLRQADRYYRTGSQRIENSLSQFLGQDVSRVQAIERLVRAASDGNVENLSTVLAVRQSLQPHEWRQIASAIIDRLGRVRPGSADALEEGAFSVANFGTNYARLSANGRRALFGDLGSMSGRSDDFINLERALDNLARVAKYQQGVEQMANNSRSGVNAQNFGSIAGLANPGTMLPTLGLLATMTLTGEMLTNPAFVRWLASAPKAGSGASGMRRHIAALAQIAARDPALAPVHAELVRRGVENFQPEAGQSPAPQGQQPARMQPAQ